MFSPGLMLLLIMVIIVLAIVVAFIVFLVFAFKSAAGGIYIAGRARGWPEPRR